MVAPELQKGIEYGFLDSSVTALDQYKPALLVNDCEQGEKVLTTLIDELKTCDEFYFSVAFVTQSGVQILLQTLIELEEKNIKGKIIASQYQDFTDPKALERLRAFNNIELRIVTDDKSMHTKGYIFRHGEEYTSIIGSSNLTQTALCENKEWNIKVVSTKDGGVTKDALKEFNKLFDMSTEVTDDFLEAYKLIYEQKKYWTNESYKAYKENVVEIGNKVNPNSMQSAAILNLKDLRDNGAKRALLISATGTGKTYLSAFDVNEFNPNRFLFLIHREQIAKDALNSFKRVIGYNKNMSVFSGNHKDYDSDYLFATIESISRDNVLKKFDPEDFDYIVIDEAHRSGAPTYQKVLNYFKPKFLLGMTATPERSDGYDIYELFDHNIAFEIRLQDAMKEKLICPFHYYGIADITVDGNLIDDKAGFNLLTSDERVKHIIKQSQFYGYSGDRVKGLVFCSRNEICDELSEKFNKLGFKTVSLSGEKSQQEREDAVKRLQQDEMEDRLDYIFTVDIFNEGVDIPAINQVIMLRPTKSAIIFVQQLGRGLRNYIDKDYLVVIDFIGNYDKNFLIPVALSGDVTFNKDNVRKYVAEGNRCIQGCSTINFDKISEEKIYASINKMKLKISEYKEQYFVLKNRLGRVPTLVDFEKEKSLDPHVILEYAGSYYEFLKKVDKDYSVSLNNDEINVLKFISQFLVYDKRPQESLILKELIYKDSILVKDVENLIKSNFGIEDSASLMHAIDILQGGFFEEKHLKKFKLTKIVKFDGTKISRTSEYNKFLKNKDLEELISDVAKCMLVKYEKINALIETNGFVRYGKYSRRDFCRVNNWPINEEATIFGYRVKNNSCPIFVTYEKDTENISKSTNYDDGFDSASIFNWMSRNNCTLEKDEIKEIINAKSSGLFIPLFVKKSDGEGFDFYYIGELTPNSWKQTTIENDKGKILPIVNFKFEIDKPVRKDLLDYFDNN